MAGFHRVFALVLLALAALFVGAGLLRHARHHLELELLSGAAVIVVAVAIAVATSLVRGGDPTEQEPTAQATLVPRRR